MDILTHTLSGIAVAGAVAGLTSKSLSQKAAIILCGAAGAVLPDIDAITYWSQFDTLIGRPLDLAMSGRDIYFANHWYSHHNWTHSLAAGAIFTLLMGLLCYLGDRIAFKIKPLNTFWKKRSCYLGAFFLGYTMHLLGDLPTPGYTWQGIKLFWPLSSPVGGTGHLWWWNNYDIFILLAVCCTAIILMIALYPVFKKPLFKILPLLVFIITLLSIFHQITDRPVRFTYGKPHIPRAEKEKQSHQIQKEILGPTLYRFMASMDRHIKIPF